MYQVHSYHFAMRQNKSEDFSLKKKKKGLLSAFNWINIINNWNHYSLLILEIRLLYSIESSKDILYQIKISDKQNQCIKSLQYQSSLPRRQHPDSHPIPHHQQEDFNVWAAINC